MEGFRAGMRISEGTRFLDLELNGLGLEKYPKGPYESLAILRT